jgi:hypothetical protein
MSRMRLPHLRQQPDAPGELNGRDEEHTEKVEVRADEVVWAKPEVADQWNARVWRARP